MQKHKERVEQEILKTKIIEKEMGSEKRKIYEEMKRKEQEIINNKDKD